MLQLCHFLPPHIVLDRCGLFHGPHYLTRDEGSPFGRLSQGGRGEGGLPRGLPCRSAVLSVSKMEPAVHGLAYCDVAAQLQREFTDATLACGDTRRYSESHCFNCSLLSDHAVGRSENAPNWSVGLVMENPGITVLQPRLGMNPLITLLKTAFFAAKVFKCPLFHGRRFSLCIIS